MFKANGVIGAVSCDLAVIQHKLQHVTDKTSAYGLTLALPNDWAEVIPHRPEEETHREIKWNGSKITQHNKATHTQGCNYTHLAWYDLI